MYGAVLLYGKSCTKYTTYVLFSTTLLLYYNIRKLTLKDSLSYIYVSLASCYILPLYYRVQCHLCERENWQNFKTVVASLSIALVSPYLYGTSVNRRASWYRNIWHLISITRLNISSAHCYLMLQQRNLMLPYNFSELNCSQYAAVTEKMICLSYI